MKRVLGVLGGCLAAILLLAVVCVGISYYMMLVVCEWPGGMRPTYGAADYDPRLTREASTAKVVIAALDRYRSNHAVFPVFASQLAPYQPSPSAAPNYLSNHFVRGWHYWKTDNGQGYRISRRLGWDPVLFYEYHHSKGSWLSAACQS